MSSDRGKGSPESIFEWTTDTACLKKLLGIAQRLGSPDPVIFSEYRRLYAIRHALRSRVGALEPKFDPKPLLDELDVILLDLPSGELTPPKAAEMLKWRVSQAKYHCELAVAYPRAAHIASESHVPSPYRPNNIVRQGRGSDGRRSSPRPTRCLVVTMCTILLILMAGTVAIVYWGIKRHTEAVKGSRINSSTSSYSRAYHKTSDHAPPDHTDASDFTGVHYSVPGFTISGWASTPVNTASDHTGIPDYPGSYRVSRPDSTGGYYVYYPPGPYSSGQPDSNTVVYHTSSGGYYVYYNSDNSGYYTVMYNPGTGGYYVYSPDISGDRASVSVAYYTGTPQVDDPDLRNRVM